MHRESCASNRHERRKPVCIGCAKLAALSVAECGVWGDLNGFHAGTTAPTTASMSTIAMQNSSGMSSLKDMIYSPG
jgi:hypothetical protein